VQLLADWLAMLHAHMLLPVLRTQWKWDGFVVSDYDAWADIVKTHHYVDTQEEAAAVGLNAGERARTRIERKRVPTMLY
jgi:beta-glucosidase-like glycosyl hydrolase